jgi:thymidylate synthase
MGKEIGHYMQPDFHPDQVILKNYDPHPALKGELTVAGGLYEGKNKK